jgi:hypothetical protein
MTKFNPEADYENRLASLRLDYVNSSPNSRYKIIMKRVDGNEHAVSNLVTVVSGVEAIARSIVVHHTQDNETIESRYEKYKHKNPDELVEAVFMIYRRTNPSSYFAEDTWSLFVLAIKFRNLVVHECTFLGQDKLESLIAATKEVLQEIATISNLN